MKYKVVMSNQFRKDLRLAAKRGKNIDKINKIIKALANGETLDLKYRDHTLIGEYSGLRECHIEPDWLLVYQIDEGMVMLLLSRSGTHSDLF